MGMSETSLEPDLRRVLPGWLVFAILFWGFGPYSNYSGAGSLDPWFPTGYFLDFSGLRERFGFLYYVSRIPYIVIGLGFYSVFTPHVANFALNVLFLWLACVGLYCATARPFGRVPAIIATATFAFSTYTAASMAWDYPDGPAIAFMLLGFWFVVSPPQGMRNSARWIAVGFIWGISGAINLIAGLVILPSCVLALVLSGISPIEWTRRTALILTGVGAMLLVFGVISTVWFGDFWFLGPQIRQLIYSMTTPSYLSDMWGTGYDWIERAFRDAALLGILAAGIAALGANARHANEPAVKMSAILIGLFALSAAAFAVVEFGLHSVVLRVSYHSSYLVVPAYLALAGTLTLLMRGWTPRDRWRGGALAVIVVACIPFVAGSISIWAQGHPRMIWLLQALPAFLVFVAFTVTAPTARRVVASLAFLSLVALPSVAMRADKAFNYVFAPNRATYDAALKVSDILRTGVAKGRPIRFWFDLGEPYTRTFNSIASLYLWQWSDLSKDLSSPGNTEAQGYLSDHTLVIHLTSDPTKLNAREAQMSAHGIMFGPRRDILIKASPQMEFTVILQDIVGHSNSR